MDTALLTSEAFWNDPRPFSAGSPPDLPELAGHVVFETSGSSGAPKGVALSKAALLASAGAVNRHLEVDRTSRWGLPLPLHHVGGFGVVARAFSAGCAVIDLRGKWNPPRFREAMERENVTHTSLVPTQVHDLVKAGLKAPSALRAIVVGGGKLDEATGQAARGLGWPVLASYGMTEAGSQIATQPLELLEKPYHSSPIPLLPIWEARNPADGRLEISGPALFSGYLAGGVFVPREGEWHTTSDRVLLADSGLTPLGRADLLVKVLGELVDPEAIEQELIGLGGGLLARGSFAVAAIPDDRAGNLLVPVFDATLPAIILLDILSRYNSASPGFRRLGSPLVLETLPKSDLGKPLRAEISAICRERAAR